MTCFGVDIGGSGIKGAPVDLKAGRLTTKRRRIPTPHPAKPQAVMETAAAIVDHFKWRGPVGCTLPAIVRDGVAHSAANIDESWLGTNGAELLTGLLGVPVLLVNDADAAGVAEMRYGAGVGRRGVVLVLTFGTGIGSALFTDGHLVPNTEFGHVRVGDTTAEEQAAGRLREEGEVSWAEWGGAVQRVLAHYEEILSPDLMILGGGISKNFDRFSEYLTTTAAVAAAQLRNAAGIVGAALMAHERFR